MPNKSIKMSTWVYRQNKLNTI